MTGPGPLAVAWGFIRYAWALLALSISALFLGPLVIVSSFFTRALQEPAIHAWNRLALRLCGVSLKVEGLENIDPRQRYVFMSNHQSLLDVPCLIMAIPNSLRFVAKRSLLKVPIFGQALRALGTVDVDRRDHVDAMRKLQEAANTVAQHHSVLFFAEGTRSPDGTLRPFKRGGVTMASLLRVPVVPVAVSGTRSVLSKGARYLRPGTARVLIGRPIPVDSSADSAQSHLQMLQQVHQQVVQLMDKYR